MTQKAYTINAISEIAEDYSYKWIGGTIETLQNPLWGINAFYTRIPVLKEILHHIENKTTPEITEKFHTQIEMSDATNNLSVTSAIIKSQNTQNTITYNTKEIKEKKHKELSIQYTKRSFPMSRKMNLDENDDYLTYIYSPYGCITQLLNTEKIKAYNEDDEFKENWQKYYEDYLPKNITEHEKIEWIQDVRNGEIPEPTKNKNHLWNTEYGLCLIQDCITWIFQNIALIDKERFQKTETIGPLFNVFLNPESMLSLLYNLDTLNKERHTS